MSDTRFRASNSASVSEQLRAVLTRAEQEGVLAITLRAARWLVEELERTPFEFGESREYLENAELHWRIVFVPPLYGHFAIHEATRTVFVGRIGWSERKKVG